MGDRVRFWEDLWCGDTPLKLSFPILCEAADNKGALVSSYMEREADRILWIPKFRRLLNDWEIDSLASLLARLDTHPKPAAVEDSRRWIWDARGSVRSFFHALVGEEPATFPAKFVRGNPVPSKSKVAFFVWTASQILTVDHLISRKWAQCLHHV